jgi:hypothetical protein
MFKFQINSKRQIQNHQRCLNTSQQKLAIWFVRFGILDAAIWDFLAKIVENKNKNSG